MKNSSRIILILLGLFSIFFSFNCKSQKLDSLFTNEGTLVVDIKEVTSDGIKFVYPKEDIINTIYKNAVFKIIFKSGRTQLFSESSSFNLVTGGDDWEKVTISQVETEVKGLYKLEQVTSKAKGATIYSNMNKVKNRAYDKLKIETALLGGNVIYLTDQKTDGNSYGGYFQAGKSTETNLSGIAYSNRRPKYSELVELIGFKREFNIIGIDELKNNDTQIYKKQFKQSIVNFDDIIDENGNVFVLMRIPKEENSKYRVTYFDDKKIVLMQKNRDKIVNYILSPK
jgi:hypothetical protein